MFNFRLLDRNRKALEGQNKNLGPRVEQSLNLVPTTEKETMNRTVVECCRISDFFFPSRLAKHNSCCLGVECHFSYLRKKKEGFFLYRFHFSFHLFFIMIQLVGYF